MKKLYPTNNVLSNVIVARKIENVSARSWLLTSALYFLLLLSQALVAQQPAVAEAPLPEVDEPVVVEGRAHYSFTLPHSDMVHSGSSQSVLMEYNRSDIVEVESAAARTQSQENAEEPTETTLASDL